MTEGAVAIIDALGFKGIWQRHDPNQVLTKLRQQKQNAELDIGLFHQRFPQSDDFHIMPRVQFLSDTIVVGVQIYPYLSLLTPSDRDVPELAQVGDAYADLQRFIALKQCLLTVAVTVADGLTLGPALTYRGAVAYGQFEIDGEFLIGPAIDEAAENHEQADGPFVFLCESAVNMKERGDAASEHIQNLDQRFDYLTSLLSLDAFDKRYRVPLKDGSFHDTYVLDPLRDCPENERAAWIGTYLQTFGDSPAVAKKRQNAVDLFKMLGYGEHV